jgi:hypothetical protein
MCELLDKTSGKIHMKSKYDPKRNTVGKIYRDAQMTGEKRVVIGDAAYEIKKDLVVDINEAIVEGEKAMGNKPFYLAIYEKYDLMLKKGLVRIRKITKYRPYPEQDSMVFLVKGGSVYMCWELPHRSQMRNIIMNFNLYDPKYVQMLRHWENLNLDHFGFMKDEIGNWVENPKYDKDFLIGSKEGKKEVKLLI